MMFSGLLRIFACAFAAISVYTCERIVKSHIRIISTNKKSVHIEDILRDRTLCFLLFSTAALIVSYAFSLWLLPIGIITASVLSKRAPAVLDERAKQKLRSACDEQADVMADIIAMGVKSGLSFDSAIRLYCMKFDNELAHHMFEAYSQWSSGLASRQQALMHVSDHIDSKTLKRFSDTSLQAIHHGSPLADMLSRFSSDIRRLRKNAIERQIEKAPIKMLIPTGICILPAMLILVMGPVILQFIQSSY